MENLDSLKEIDLPCITMFYIIVQIPHITRHGTEIKYAVVSETDLRSTCKNKNIGMRPMRRSSAAGVKLLISILTIIQPLPR